MKRLDARTAALIGGFVVACESARLEPRASHHDGGAVRAIANRAADEAQARDADETPAPRDVLRDREFTGRDDVSVRRLELSISLPDEHPRWAVDRRLEIFDEGDRASITIAGTGAPWVPGTRIAARAGWGEFAMVAPDRARYRVASPDELRTWFLGAAPRMGSNLAFHRTDRIVIATRGALSLVIASEPGTERHPLTCRSLVALLLGGDPAAARIGCENAGLPSHVSLRAHGWLALAIDRTEEARENVTRESLAVPPVGASSDMALPVRATSGAFFLASELLANEAHATVAALTLTNQLEREAWVFVDEMALGWLAPGSTSNWEGLTAGHHTVRVRSLDGLERSRRIDVALPNRVELANEPLLER